MKRAAFFALAAALGFAQPAFAQEAIKVGAVEGLTGPIAKYGVPIRHGIELAVDQVNAKGVLGGRKIAMIFEDSAGLKKQALTLIREEAIKATQHKE